MSVTMPRCVLSPLRLITAILLTSVALVGVGAIAAPAAADVPATPAPAFNIACEGETDEDPSDGWQDISDLTLVSAGRLDKYNAGQTVMLYDYAGTNDLPFTPICGVRYDAQVGGPVAEWMFCTDYWYFACAQGDIDGNLNHAGVPVGPLAPMPGNEKLTDEQNRMISYLIQNGHPYTVDPGNYWVFSPATFARRDGSTAERGALQILVWCISETEYIEGPGASSQLGLACAQTMNESAQQELLAMVPEAPELSLDVTGPTGPFAIGDSVQFELETNVFNQPIALEVDGDADIELCPGTTDAEIAGGELAIAGDADVLRTVDLCVVGEEAGEVTVNITATPASPLSIRWNQSAHPDPNWDCQNYATFHRSDAITLVGSASVTFAHETTDDIGGTDDGGDTDRGDGGTDGSVGADPDGESGVAFADGLPDTGSPGLVLAALVLALTLFMAGLGCVMVARRRAQDVSADATIR